VRNNSRRLWRNRNKALPLVLPGRVGEQALTLSHQTIVDES
jgi:hypothetical protein